MAKKRTSLKLEKATEEYLASLGSSRDNLTDEQWKYVSGFIRAKKFTKPMIISFMVLAVLLLCLTFLYSYWTNYEIAKAIPNRTVYFYKAGDNASIALTPRQIREYLELLSSLSFNTGPAFVLAVFLFMAVFIIPLYRWKTRKIIEAFVRPKQQPQANPPNIPAPPQ